MNILFDLYLRVTFIFKLHKVMVSAITLNNHFQIKSHIKLMKKLITLLLILTIQITFMQKVMASVPLLKSDFQTMNHCKMDMANKSACHDQSINMENCQSDCEMMNVVSITHFINHDKTLSFDSKPFNYPDFLTTIPNPQSMSLYRPPLFS